MQLRPHQNKAIDMCRESIKAGLKRPILGCPTSFGKTVVAASMLESCQSKGKKGWFMMDRIQLINQTIEKFKSFDIDFGVRQADHELKNAQAPIQIASIQTVDAMVKKHNGRLPEMDFLIVDECHTQHSIVKQIMKQFDNIPVIGLTATPYSKELGKHYNNLLVPITPRELLEGGYLTPVRYYAGTHIDLSKIRSANANTFNQDDLRQATDENKDLLTGSIVKNWLKYAEGMQTIAFSPSQDHSKFLVSKLNEAGVSAEHIDCYTPEDERQDLMEAHNNGEFMVLSCSRLLNTGYDSPTTQCVIDCFSTKSVTTYVQRVGRIQRIAEGKECAVYLDHAGNFETFGFAEDIVPESLDDGEKTHREQELVKKEKKEGKKQECPACFQLMAGWSCQACGYEYPKAQQMEDDGSILVEMEAGKKANKTTHINEKTAFLAELRLHAKEKGKKEGWAAYIYRERFGVWPNKIRRVDAEVVTQETKNWLKHHNIKQSHRRKNTG